MPKPLVAVLDACVLYPAVIRDTLLLAAEAGAYQFRWTDELLLELRRNLFKDRAAPEDRVDKMLADLAQFFDDGKVSGHERDIAALRNQPKDRHVLAAAIEAGAELVVTENLKDLPLGVHTVDLLVVDQHGSYGSTRATVVAEDTAGPTIANVALTPSCLWPASHKYVPFVFGTDLTADVVDVCNPQAARVRIVSIVSNQPDNGTGDGDTANDIRSGRGGFCLRAERAGGSPEGRIYSITLEGVDGAGHKSQTTVAISAGVAHDQRRHACAELPLTAFVEDDDARCSFPPEEPSASQPIVQPAITVVPEEAAPEGCAAAPGTASAALALVLLYRARRSNRRY